MVSCVALDLQVVQECVDYVVDTRWLCNQGYEFHGDLMAIAVQASTQRPDILRTRYIQSFILAQKVKERSGKEECTREK